MDVVDRERLYVRVLRPRGCADLDPRIVLTRQSTRPRTSASTAFCTVARLAAVMVTVSASLSDTAVAPLTVATALSTPLTQLLQQRWTLLNWTETSAAAAAAAKANENTNKAKTVGLGFMEERTNQCEESQKSNRGRISSVERGPLPIGRNLKAGAAGTAPSRERTNFRWRADRRIRRRRECRCELSRGAVNGACISATLNP